MRCLKRLSFALLMAVSFGLILCLSDWRRVEMQSTLRRVTTTSEEAINLNPSISGDGRLVAFESSADIAGTGINDSFHAIRADVSTIPPTFLQMSASRAPAPAVSQDGSRIAFASFDNPLGTNSDSNSEVFLYDGAKLTQITHTAPDKATERTSEGNFLPSISDNGRFIAFSSNRNLTDQNDDASLEIYLFDSFEQRFTQVTNASGAISFTDAKISGDGATIAYLKDSGSTPGASRDLILQHRSDAEPPLSLATNAPKLALTYGRAISDDGKRVVWSAETDSNSTQVFLYDGRNHQTRQITNLGTRLVDVPLHPTISGDGSRIGFATRRPVSGVGTNSDGSVELYLYDIPSDTFARITNTSANEATADVLSSLNDDGSIIAFNFPRVLTGVLNVSFVNNSEIYLTSTPPRPAFGTIRVVNGASFGNEPSTTEAVAPDSIAVAFGNNLAASSEQSQRLPDGTFPTSVLGTTVTVSGRPAQIFYVSPVQVNFLVPPETELGFAEIVVTNSDGFPYHDTVTTLRAAPGIFTSSGNGVGEGVILQADTLEAGPFDPTTGDLRLTIFATGVRRSLQIAATAGGRPLTLESIVSSQGLPGLDEVHVLVPADLRGAGKVDLTIRADLRDSNPVSISFTGDPQRDIVINEFLADPPGSQSIHVEGDANADGQRSGSADEFVELINATARDIDISGYQLLTTGTSGETHRHTFNEGTILNACSAIVVFGGGNPSPEHSAFGGALIQTASTGSLSLTNNSGVITLREKTGAVVSFIAYGGATGLDADDNQSLTRSPDVTGTFAKHLEASSGARAFSPGTQLSVSPFAPCGPRVARLELLPTMATIDVGVRQQFHARALDETGNEVSGVIFSWESGDQNIATIDQNGLASALSPGATEIRATGRGIISSPATLRVNSIAPPNVVINEVDSDQAGTDTEEFVELYDGGAGNTSLAGLVIVFYNGGDDKSYAAFDLDDETTNALGYFTLGNAAVPGVDQIFGNGLMQNGGDAVALYVGNAADFPNGTVLVTKNLVDALVYDSNDADDPGLLTLLEPGEPQANEDMGGNGTMNSNQRCPDGAGGARRSTTVAQFAPTSDGINICVVPAPPPEILVNDLAIAEGDSGTTTFAFTVSLSSPAPAGGITFDIATADNTAVAAENDYIATELTNQTITAGNQRYEFVVTVTGDLNVEPG